MKTKAAIRPIKNTTARPKWMLNFWQIWNPRESAEDIGEELLGRFTVDQRMCTERPVSWMVFIRRLLSFGIIYNPT